VGLLLDAAALIDEVLTVGDRQPAGLRAPLSTRGVA
jgi:hypothetical protein